MPGTYTQVCGLAGHYQRFIKGFANIACPLYDILGKEVKVGLVDLSSIGAGSHEYPEKEGPVCACPGVPRF